MYSFLYNSVPRHSIFWCSTLLTVLFTAGSQGLAADSPQAVALLQQVGLQRGICVLLGPQAESLAVDVARHSSLLVYVQLDAPERVAALRRDARQAGLDATHIHIETGSPDHLHLASNLADVVYAADAQTATPDAEIMRVLRPRGRAILAARTLVKPVPANSDDWTHPYHSPNNNPLSRDQHVVAPYLTQFLANPRYGPAPQNAVAAGGRVFKIYGNVAWHEREEPYLNSIVAYDGYNGTILWKYDLPAGMMVHRNVFIATPTTLFVGDDKSCKLLDAETGALVDELVPPEDLAGGTFWKWMALCGDTLYAVTGEAELPSETKLWKREEHGWPWNEISRGYNIAEQPWGYGRNVLAIDVPSKQVLWHYHEQEPIDTRAVCMSHGQLYAFRFGSFLTCLDTTTGVVKWRKTPENDPQLFATMGTYQPRQGWQTNWRTSAYLKCSRDALYFAGTQLEKLLALSTRDGSLLWQHPYGNFQLVLHPDALYAISGPWGTNVSKKFEPLTGKVLAELPTGRRACTRPTGTSDSILYRAMGGSVRFDLASERPRWVSPMRPSCHDGVTVAGGLLYWWPYACDCQLNLYGVTCLGPAGGFDFTPDWRDPQRLQQHAELDKQVALSADEQDWPTFRANNQGTAVTKATVPANTRVRWTAAPQAAVAVRPTPPTAVGSLVFVGGSDGVVRALDAATGETRWEAETGAELRLPPTITAGRALVGSGDGWVYCFAAHCGDLLWRFRAAPADRLIPVYGQLLSTWPVGSGVLVEDDTAYFAAGIANYDGTYVYAVDPTTGYVRWCNDTSGHLDQAAEVGVSVQGHLLTHAGRLYMAGGNAVSPAEYDLRDGNCLNDPAALSTCESTSPRGWELFLIGDKVIACGPPYYAHPDIPVYDHTVTKKMLHARCGGRDIVWLDDRILMSFDHIDQALLDQCVTDQRIPRHIIQAWGQFKIDMKPHWGITTPDATALAIAANAVVIGTQQGLAAVDPGTGKPLWTHRLPAPVVPWGVAITRSGQVIATLKDGSTVCVGEK